MILSFLHFVFGLHSELWILAGYASSMMITAYIHCAYTCAHVDTGHAGLAAGSARNDSEQGGPFGNRLCATEQWPIRSVFVFRIRTESLQMMNIPIAYQSTTCLGMSQIQDYPTETDPSQFILFWRSQSWTPIPALRWWCSMIRSKRWLYFVALVAWSVGPRFKMATCAECSMYTGFCHVQNVSKAVRLSHMSKNHYRVWIIVNLKQIINEISNKSRA